MSTIKSIFIQHLNGTTPNATMDTNGNFTVGGTVSGASSNMFRNRLINGAMVIDQRNAGASVSLSSNPTYTLDRWIANYTQNSKFTVQQNAGSVTPPTGFGNYLGVTSSSSYSVATGDLFAVRQYIEGFNFYDLAFGTSNAKTVTLSFWVYSSLTGTFGGSLANYAFTRSYPFSYTISSANTWTYITITIPGDTTGTWVGASSSGAALVCFGLGAGSTYSGTANTWAATAYNQPTGTVSVVGTSGATFYITGVQLEVGTAATPFEFRQYGTELDLCQRYYWQGNGLYVYNGTGSTITAGGQTCWGRSMRATPTTTVQTGGIIAASNTGVTHYVSGVTSGASGNPGIITASIEL